MLRKLQLWWLNRRKHTPSIEVVQKNYTQEELGILLENAYKVGYTDGRRDGLAIAREQATKSLKEILWQQNQKKNS